MMIFKVPVWVLGSMPVGQLKAIRHWPTNYLPA